MERLPHKGAPRKPHQFRGGRGRHVSRRGGDSARTDAEQADDLSRALYLVPGKRLGLLVDCGSIAMGDGCGRNGSDALTILSGGTGVIGGRPMGPIESGRRPGLEAPGAGGKRSLVAARVGTADAVVALWWGFRASQGKPRIPVLWGWPLTIGAGWADLGRPAAADCGGRG